MRNRLILAASFAALCSPNVFLTADKGGASGGGAAKSPADELKDLRTEKDQLTRDLATANGTISTLNTDLSSARESAKTHTADLKAANDKVTQLTTDLKTANDQIADLKKNAKTVADTATEQAAAAGVLPANKDAAAVAAGTKDLKATHDEYVKLRGRAKSAFFRKNEEDLMAYAAQVAKDARENPEV